MSVSPIEIKKECLILCEGRDEENFLNNFLTNRSQTECQDYVSKIQVLNFGGNEELPSYIQALKVSPNFSKVRSMLIIRDAEKDADKASSQIQSALRKANLPVPNSVCQWENGTLRVGFLLFPSCSNELCNGTLEDLCIDILKESEDDGITTMVDEFLDTIESKRQAALRHRHKSKLHTYFSVNDKYVGQKIGEAARSGALDWGSDKLKPMTSFIRELFQ